MPARSILHVKNFERFQHYRDRTPPWIKLYNDLLDDYAFACLPDASKSHLILIWLLASRSENRVPNDAAWIGRRIGATEPVDVQILVRSGFITVENTDSEPLAERKQDDDLERETEGEIETEEETEQNDAVASLSGSGKPNSDQRAVNRIWEHWLQVSGKGKSKLTKERRQKIRARLKSFPESELCEAISRAHQNPFYLGENDRATYYGNLETIFKTDTAVAGHLEYEPTEGATPTLTVVAGGLLEREQADLAKAQRERDNVERERVAEKEWQRAVHERFAELPEAERERWKDRVRPRIQHMEPYPERHAKALRLMVFEQYGESIGLTRAKFLQRAS